MVLDVLVNTTTRTTNDEIASRPPQDVDVPDVLDSGALIASHYIVPKSFLEYSDI